MAKKASRRRSSEMPSDEQRARAKGLLVAKGVTAASAAILCGEDDDTLTNGDIAARRIAWQQTLPRALP